MAKSLKKIKARNVSCMRGKYEMRVLLKGRSDCGARQSHGAYANRRKNPGWPVLNVSTDTVLAEKFRKRCVRDNVFAAHRLTERLTKLCTLGKGTLKKKVANVRLSGTRGQQGFRLKPSVVSTLRRTAKKHDVTVTGIINVALAS